MPRNSQQRVFQQLQTSACLCAHRDDRRALEERAAREFFNLKPHEAENVGIDQIRLRDGHQPAPNPEQAANIEMLARLRLDRFVGRDHQHDQVDAAHARQHVANEPFVTRNIDESKADALQFQERETQVDGDPAALLFFETVGIRACKRFDQG